MSEILRLKRSLDNQEATRDIHTVRAEADAMTGATLTGIEVREDVDSPHRVTVRGLTP